MTSIVDSDISTKPNIVRAWFDTVIQPILLGVDREKRFLAAGNYTYRFQPERMDYFDTIESHVGAQYFPNLKQFWSFSLESAQSSVTHDRCLNDLFHACHNYHAGIRTSSKFREVCREIAARVPGEIGGQVSDYFGAYRSEDEFIAVLAENIVNNKLELTARLRNWKIVEQVSPGDCDCL